MLTDPVTPPDYLGTIWLPLWVTTHQRRTRANLKSLHSTREGPDFSWSLLDVIHCSVERALSHVDWPHKAIFQTNLIPTPIVHTKSCRLAIRASNGASCGGSWKSSVIESTRTRSRTLRRLWFCRETRWLNPSKIDSVGVRFRLTSTKVTGSMLSAWRSLFIQREIFNDFTILSRPILMEFNSDPVQTWWFNPLVFDLLPSNA